MAPKAKDAKGDDSLIAEKKAQLRTVKKCAFWHHALKELLENPLCNTNKGQGAGKLFKDGVEHVKELAPDEVSAEIVDIMEHIFEANAPYKHRDALKERVIDEFGYVAEKEAQLSMVKLEKKWDNALRELLQDPLCNTNKGTGAKQLFKDGIEYVKSIVPNDAVMKQINEVMENHFQANKPSCHKRKLQELLDREDIKVPAPTTPLPKDAKPVLGDDGTPVKKRPSPCLNTMAPKAKIMKASAVPRSLEATVAPLVPLTPSRLSNNLETDITISSPISKEGLATCRDMSCADALRDPLTAYNLDADVILKQIHLKSEQLSFEDNVTKLGLMPDEIAAIVAYTYDSGSGRQDDQLFYHLNNDLRKRSASQRTSTIQLWGSFLKHLMNGLGKLSAYEGKVFRGYPDKATVLSKYKTGCPIQWGAFSSTSESEVTAKAFTNQEHGVIFEINILDGKRIQPFSFFPVEGEVLLSPNAILRPAGPPEERAGWTFLRMTEDGFGSTFFS